MHGSSRLYFATSNAHKFRECRHVLAEFDLVPSRLPGKGRELQTDDVAEVAAWAAADAFKLHRKPLIVEDTGLFVESLHGFPGPYAAYAMKTIGLPGLLGLLAGGRSRRATFRSAVAYCSSAAAPRVFEGSLRGEIAASPAGRRGFGFDPVFVPEGSDLTLAQMTLAKKCSVSHRAAALRAFGAWYTSSPGR